MQSFSSELAPKYSKNIVKQIDAKAPSVFLTCLRSKNNNIIVYEANIQNGRFSKNNPVEGYWLVIDQVEQYKRRRSGFKFDRAEFTSVQKTFAYGFSAAWVSDREACFRFTQFPNFKFTVMIKDGVAKAFCKQNGRKYIVRSLYIDATENYQTLDPSSNVKRLELNCIDIETKKSTVLNIKKLF